MLYVLLFISVFIDTLKNICLNYFGKSRLQETRDVILFNTVSCVGSVLFFVLSGASLKISAYSFGLAICFAAVTVGAQFFSLLSMSLGSMSYSVLFTYLSMLIPTLFGIVYYGYAVSPRQVVGVVLMIGTFYFSIELKKGSPVTAKWLAVAMGSFTFWGLVGICQQLHQNSEFADELDGFLLWTFILSIAMFSGLYALMRKSGVQRKKYETISSRWGYCMESIVTVCAVLSGVIIGAVNKINLYLSGKMPSVIFFPIINGGVIILSGFAAILIFRERLDRKQQIGIVLGIVSVCLLGI